MVRNMTSSTKHAQKLKMIPFKAALLKFDSSQANKKNVLYAHFSTLYAAGLLQGQLPENSWHAAALVSLCPLLKH